MLQDRDSMPNCYTINHPTTLHTHNETQWLTAAHWWQHLATPGFPSVPILSTSSVQMSYQRRIENRQLIFIHYVIHSSECQKQKIVLDVYVFLLQPTSQTMSISEYSLFDLSLISWGRTRVLGSTKSNFKVRWKLEWTLQRALFPICLRFRIRNWWNQLKGSKKHACRNFGPKI